MTYMDQPDAFDERAHACYVEAASTLSPALQGRLRAARRTALATPASGQHRAGWHHRSWPALPIGATAAALLAVAVGLHWRPGADEPLPAGMSTAQSSAAPSRQAPPARDAHSAAAINPPQPQPDALDPAHRSQAPDAALAGVQSTDDPSVLMLDEDPDFYLWLGSDDALPANTEPGHDPT